MSSLISNTIEFVKGHIKDFGPSHDWSHIERVWKNALAIARYEDVDHTIIQLAALLHDINDRKYYQGTKVEGDNRIRTFLRSQAVSEIQIDQILDIINNMSFSSDGIASSMAHRIVQDADRLDAIGAVGIARCIAYATEKGNPIHIPGLLGEHKTIGAYREKGSSSAISHFFDKLLHIKDRMLTAEGKRIAQIRHAFMERYLDQFLNEWDGLR